MRRAVTAMAVFSMLWLTPAPPADAAVATGLFPVRTDDLSPRIAGVSTDVQVRLMTDTELLAGEPVTLSVRPYGASVFTEHTATTDDGGLATVWLRLDRNATVKWRFDGDGAYAGSESTPYVLQIAPRVSRRVNDRTLRRHQRLVVRGGTFPAKPGCVVKLWRGELRPLVLGPRPVRLAVSRVHSDGTYRLRHRFRKSGRMRVAVTVAPCAGNSRGLSRYVRIRVR